MPEAKPNGLLTRGLEGKESNCFSIIQLVGHAEKAIITLSNVSWRNIYLEMKREKSRRISLLDDCYLLPSSSVAN